MTSCPRLAVGVHTRLIYFYQFTPPQTCADNSNDKHAFARSKKFTYSTIPTIFSKFKPLNTDTLLIRTLVMTVLTRFDCTQFQLTFAHFSRLIKVSVKFSTEHQIAWALAPVADYPRLALPSYFPALLSTHIRLFRNEKRTGPEMGSLLGKRRSAIGQFFSLSLGIAPGVFAEVNSAQSPRL